MDAIKNAASGLLNKGAQPSSTNANAGAAQPGQQAGGNSLIDKGVDYAQSSGKIPNTGTSEGNMIDKGQVAFDQYEAKQGRNGGL
ncbi:hypothetical protein HKX48_001465 [Thoreauomyces humboldtii]|nr:hypothetical protein HKX48_001465 [Thoreauomyces humboldtii]